MNRSRALASGALAMLALVLLSAPGLAEEADAPAIVLHLGHHTDDLHSASMGMSLARLLQKKGARVTVFLDREGVRLADARGPQDLRWGQGQEPVAAILADFVKQGGSILLCSHCAQAAGLASGSLVSGARIGSDDDVAALFLGADRVIDY